MAQIKTASGVQIAYDDKRADAILHHMSELIHTMDKIGLGAGFQLSAPLHVLGTQLNIRGISDEHLMRQLIFTAAINLKSIPEPTLSKVMDAVGVEAHRYLERPVREYHVLLPLNVEQRLLSTIQNFEVAGITFLVDSWPNAQERYATDALQQALFTSTRTDSTSDLWNLSGTPLIAKTWQRGPVEAFEEVEDAYEVIRTAFNFVNDRTPIQLERREPLANVVPAVGYGVFLADGTYQTSFAAHDYVPFQHHLAREVDLQSVLRLLTDLNSTDMQTDAGKAYRSALLSYGFGLDSTDWKDCFLSLWQSLETITFERNARYSMGDVVARVSSLLGYDRWSKDFLDICADKRNALVHSGQFSSDGEPETLLLKGIVRESLTRLRVLLSVFPTRAGLTEYFLQAGFSTKSLIERKKVIDKIQQERDRQG